VSIVGPNGRKKEKEKELTEETFDRESGVHS
jgi:hypothetical protein